VINLRIMGWVGHVTCIGDEKCIQNFSQEISKEVTTQGDIGIGGRIILK
jgi:hypothetical protein